MKKMVSFLVCMALLFSCAAAEQTVQLPRSRYVVDLPDDMDYSAPEDTDAGVEAYISRYLEMDLLYYPKAEMKKLGMADTLLETVQDRAAAGMDVELRDVNGIEILVYWVTDEADGAPGIGYVFEDGEWMIEVLFWYATQEAADRTTAIMSSIREETALLTE